MERGAAFKQRALQNRSASGGKVLAIGCLVTVLCLGHNALGWGISEGGIAGAIHDPSTWSSAAADRCMVG
jgi:hypothetical protein